METLHHPLERTLTQFNSVFGPMFCGWGILRWGWILVFAVKVIFVIGWTIWHELAWVGRICQRLRSWSDICAKPIHWLIRVIFKWTHRSPIYSRWLAVGRILTQPRRRCIIILWNGNRIHAGANESWISSSRRRRRQRQSHVLVYGCFNWSRCSSMNLRRKNLLIYLNWFKQTGEILVKLRKITFLPWIVFQTKFYSNSNKNSTLKSVLPKIGNFILSI